MKRCEVSWWTTSGGVQEQEEGEGREQDVERWQQVQRFGVVWLDGEMGEVRAVEPSLEAAAQWRRHEKALPKKSKWMIITATLPAPTLTGLLCLAGRPWPKRASPGQIHAPAPTPTAAREQISFFLLARCTPALSLSPRRQFLNSTHPC